MCCTFYQSLFIIIQIFVSQLTVLNDPKYRNFADHSKCSESLDSALRFRKVLPDWEADWSGRMHRIGETRNDWGTFQ